MNCGWLNTIMRPNQRYIQEDDLLPPISKPAAKTNVCTRPHLEITRASISYIIKLLKNFKVKQIIVSQRSFYLCGWCSFPPLRLTATSGSMKSIFAYLLRNFL